MRLEKPEKVYDDRTCIIVVLSDSREIGVIVSEVDAVVSIEEEHISVPPQIADKKSYLSWVAKLDGKVVLIMDISQVLVGDNLLNIIMSS